VTVKLVLEVAGPITDEDKVILTSTMLALISITNNAMGVPLEETEEEPPSDSPRDTGGLN
jgi:hypothetical protein